MNLKYYFIISKNKKIIYKRPLIQIKYIKLNMKWKCTCKEAKQLKINNYFKYVLLINSFVILSPYCNLNITCLSIK